MHTSAHIKKKNRARHTTVTNGCCRHSANIQYTYTVCVGNQEWYLLLQCVFGEKRGGASESGGRGGREKEECKGEQGREGGRERVSESEGV